MECIDVEQCTFGRVSGEDNDKVGGVIFRNHSHMCRLSAVEVFALFVIKASREKESRIPAPLKYRKSGFD